MPMSRMLPGLGKGQERQRPSGPGVETDTWGDRSACQWGEFTIKHGAFHHISPMDSMEFWISFSEERVRGIDFTTIDVAISTGKN